MSWLVILFLLIGGLILLILELLVIPGTTIVGVVGFILMAVGIWQSFINYGNAIGATVLLFSVLLSVLAAYMSLNSKTWNKAMLHTSIDSKVNTEANNISIGDIGLSISRINPMGKAMFDNEFYEVASLGELIDEDVQIRVLDVQKNKIIIEPFMEDDNIDS